MDYAAAKFLDAKLLLVSELLPRAKVLLTQLL